MSPSHVQNLNFDGRVCQISHEYDAFYLHEPYQVDGASLGYCANLSILSYNVDIQVAKRNMH